MKIASIHQPHYHPWLGLLDKIAHSHVHIVLDDVQFRRRNYHNRAQYNLNGESQLLTLPVQNKGLQTHGLKINEMNITSQKDLQKNFKTLQHRYGKTPGWQLIADELNLIYQTHEDSLLQLNLKLLQLMLKCFKINTPVILASTHGVSSVRNQRLVDLCLKTKADIYLSGNGAKKYMDDALFKSHGINVKYQNFNNPSYLQQKDSNFIPGCLALDWYCLHPNDASIWFKEQCSNSIEGKEFSLAL